MHSHRTLPTLLLTATFVAACAAPDTGEEDMGEAQVMEQSVEAPGCYVASGSLEEAQTRPSPLRQTEITFEHGQGLLCYGAPSARGREIMGGLLVFGAVERMGRAPTAKPLQKRS